VSKPPGAFSREIHNSQSPSRSFRHIHLSQNCISPLRDPPCSEDLTTLEPSIVRSSQLQVRSFKQQSTEIFAYCYAAPSFPTFITCNACNTSIGTPIIDSSRFFVLRSQPISANDHGCYNKSSTCRLCSYNDPPILPLHQHPCQVCMILLLLGEGGHFSNPKSNSTTLEVFLF